MRRIGSFDGVTIPIDLTIIELANLNLPDIPAMSARYNIIELCTSVKPAFFKYIFDNYPSIEQLHYLDPDTKLLSNPNPLEAALLQADVIITPHHYHPIPLDGQFPQENLALNHGIYNLGYLGLKRSEVADKLLEWWHARMIEYCRIDLVNGWFVDQLFFNYVPIYFQNVEILRHPGINFAFWNFHERTIQSDRRLLFDGIYWPIILYHFSGFSPLDSKRPTRINDSNENEHLETLLSEYAEELIHNGYVQARELKSTFQILYNAGHSTGKNRFRRLARKLTHMSKRFLGRNKNK
jgi:hypothetical protein